MRLLIYTTQLIKTRKPKQILNKIHWIQQEIVSWVLKSCMNSCGPALGEKLMQREFHYAIVDEVDSILIDEARTPLIISAPSGEAGDLYRVFTKVAEKMNENEDYEVDEKLKAITLTEKGIDKAEGYLKVGNIYTEKGMKLVHHLENAVRAKALFKRDTDYVVKNYGGGLVDGFPGCMRSSSGDRVKRRREN